MARSTRRCLAFVWLCGATVGPIGDHYHVVRGVTEYLTDFGPVWLGRSPLWFLLLVSSFMATIALLHGRLARADAPRAPAALVFASPLLVLALYLTTSFYPLREGGSLEALITGAALVMYLGLDRTRVGLGLGLLVAVGATAFEWALVQAGVFRYLPQSDELFGVAPWLPSLYLAASVAVGAVARRMMGSRTAA
ncbi:MAG: hypothetical protein KDK70_41955 [Myxococcales bacterium]|nr:hypothetical protein [Myxococcales bacterium]